MALVLGIDGGGTKTACAVARDGQILSRVKTGPSNLVRYPDDTVRENLHSAVRQACEAAGVSTSDIQAASMGLAGASRENISIRAHSIAKEVLACEVEIVGDVFIALDAATEGGPGIVVIAGTGSICLGRNERGETARAGGWGSVISDEGSGYWLGRNAVSACFRAVDSGLTTSLIRHVMSAWKIGTRDELIVRANAQPQPSFAELFPSLLAAAAENDPIAIELLTEGGAELSKLVKVVMRRLWPNHQSVRVGMVGGVFQNSGIIRQVFENSLRSERPEAIVHVVTEEPVAGAIFRAEALVAKRNLPSAN